MGTPKAWLEFGGRPLLEILVERLSSAFPTVRVIGAPGQDLPPTTAELLRDELPDQGPVGGLVTGLRDLREPFAFACSCDVPFLRIELAEYLANAVKEHEVAICEWEGRLQPLHAVYAASMQPLFQQQLAAGNRRPIAVLDQVRTRRVQEAEIRAVDPEGLSFLNVNTPQEYQEALARWEAGC